MQGYKYMSLVNYRWLLVTDTFHLGNSSQINPCPAELFQLYFSSFEAGIANAKYYYLWKIDMAKIKLLDQLSIY